MKGKRVVLKGHFHISTQELYDAVVEAEKETKRQAGKRAKTKGKANSYRARSEEDIEEEEADKYIQLARAALALHGVFDRPSLSTVQAIVLMGMFYVIFARRPQMERGWLLGQMAFSLSSSVSSIATFDCKSH